MVERIIERFMTCLSSIQLNSRFARRDVSG